MRDELEKETQIEEGGIEGFADKGHEENGKEVADIRWAWDFVEAGEPHLPPDILIRTSEDTKEEDGQENEYNGLSSSSVKDQEQRHLSSSASTNTKVIPPESTSLEIDKQVAISAPQENAPSSSSKKIDHPIPWYAFLLPYIPVKWQGVTGKTPPNMTKPQQIVYSSILAFIGIFLIHVTDYFYLLESFKSDNSDAVPVKMLSGAYAASAVLLYEAYTSPLAQPRNVIGSFGLCAVAGVSVRIFCQKVQIPEYAAGALALSVGLAVMNLTKTVHPPGGACALIAVIGGKNVHALGYGYALTSVGAAFILVSVAVIGNNLIPGRQYPLYWY